MLFDVVEMSFRGNIGAALEYAERLSRLLPNDRELARLTDDLRARLKR